MKKEELAELWAEAKLQLMRWIYGMGFITTNARDYINAEIEKQRDEEVTNDKLPKGLQI